MLLCADKAQGHRNRNGDCGHYFIGLHFHHPVSVSPHSLSQPTPHAKGHQYLGVRIFFCLHYSFRKLLVCNRLHNITPGISCWNRDCGAAAFPGSTYCLQISKKLQAKRAHIPDVSRHGVAGSSQFRLFNPQVSALPSPGFSHGLVWSGNHFYILDKNSH